MSTPDLTAVAALSARARSAAEASGPPVTRVEVMVGDASPLDWLRSLRPGQRFYWRGRGSPSVVASAGCAAVIDFADMGQAAVEMRGPLAGLPARATFMVTSRFDPDRVVDPEWHDFGRVRFLLPRFELAHGRSGARLACNVTEADRDDHDALEEALQSLLGSPAGDALPGPAGVRTTGVGRGRLDTPDENGWSQSVSSALQAFDHSTLRKVVLARRSSWSLPERLDPVAALARVARRARRSYHVMVEAGDSAFVSATPERLLRLEGRRITTEAVAGTRANGGSQQEAFTAKDHLEHSIVVEDVRDRLRPLVVSVDADEAQEMVLPRRRHLRTRIAGPRLAGTTALDVLAALHPTPAVGGTPRDEARGFISQVEPFDRGLYAGVVGRVGRDARGAECGEFAVGIRSALIRGREISLFAGAGIVPGSDPVDEWGEVEGKMSDLSTALGLP